MVQTVELLLDEASEAVVLAQWRALADAGLPSQALHAGPSNRPHVTLTAQAAIAPERELALADVLGGLPIEVRLGSLTCFGRDRYVLVRPLVATLDLLELQRRVFAVAGNGDGVRDLMRPGRWVPHVTLAHRLSAEQVGLALAVLHGTDEVDGYAVSARRWDSEGKREWSLTDGPDRTAQDGTHPEGQVAGS